MRNGFGTQNRGSGLSSLTARREKNFHAEAVVLSGFIASDVFRPKLHRHILPSGGQ